MAGAGRRELAEASGISAGAITLAGGCPVHVDVHSIPANQAKRERDHQHFDFRFLFRADHVEAVTLQAEEVSGHAWRDADTIADDRLRDRIRAALTAG